MGKCFTPLTKDAFVTVQAKGLRRRKHALEEHDHRAARDMPAKAIVGA